MAFTRMGKFKADDLAKLVLICVSVALCLGDSGNCSARD